MTVQFGAYGLTLADLPVGPEWWNPAPAHWTRLALHWDETPVEGLPPEKVGPHDALVQLPPCGFADMDRRAARVRLRMPEPPDPHDVIHPYFTSLAAVSAYWTGWESFHAGAFVMGDAVWGLLGDSERGKSSALGWICAAGGHVFTDDLLVVSGATALAGPRSLDLREGAAEHLGLGDAIENASGRRRWRVRLEPVPAELPLAGWVLLDWDPAGPALRSVAVSERLPVLLHGRALLTPRANSVDWLELASAPMFVLGRPRDWSCIDQSMEMLINALGQLSG